MQHGKRVVGLSGNLQRPSKTRSLVHTLLGAIAARHDVATELYDLTDFGPALGTALKPGDLTPAGQQALAAILSADALVIASPTYKGSYAGLFKHLVDLIDPLALREKPVLLAATGGGDRHMLVVEHNLRPLFGFFEAATLPTAIYASDRDFTEGVLTSAPVLERVDRAVAQLGRALHLGDPAAHRT